MRHRDSIHRAPTMPATSWWRSMVTPPRHRAVQAKGYQIRVTPDLAYPATRPMRAIPR